MTDIKHIFVFPDIHGRRFWKEPVLKYKDDLSKQFVFLGDYFDPYPFDFINPQDAYINWQELWVTLKDRENTTWLLGNHDWHYLHFMWREYGCRRSEELKHNICDIITTNFDTFKIAYEHIMDNGVKFLFTHAGVTYGWAKRIDTIINNRESEDGYKEVYNAEFLNSLKDTKEYNRYLWEIGYDRGGDHPIGSCIWADMNEHIHSYNLYKENSFYDNLYQVFSHSYCQTCYITDKFAMIDCKHPFVIDCTNGRIIRYEFFEDDNVATM